MTHRIAWAAAALLFAVVTMAATTAATAQSSRPFGGAAARSFDVGRQHFQPRPQRFPQLVIRPGGFRPGGGSHAATHCPPGRKALGRLCIKVSGVPCPPGQRRRHGTCKGPDNIANPGSLTLPCAKGHKRVGRRCIDVVEPCPRHTVRRHGRCVADPIDTADPGIVKPCGKGHKRVGKRCIDVVTPCPPGTTRHRGHCDRVSEPPVVTIPEIGCGKGLRRGKHRDCVAVTPPGGSDAEGSSGGAAKPPPSPPRVAAPAPNIPANIRALIDGRPHRPREVLVLLATADAAEVTTEIMRRHSLVAVDSELIALIDATLVRFELVDNRPLERVLTALIADGSILSAQPNYVYAASDAGVATSLGKHYPQYAPDKMRIREAHAIASGRGVKLAVIDTAADETHPELAGAIADRFDALREGEIAAEPHGTAITGLISARLAMQGVAPEARVLSVRAFASSEGGAPQSTSQALVRGINWAFGAEARLFNLSFAGPNDELLGKVIAAAGKRGAIFIAAAGNDGPEASPAYPAAFPGVIAVTATDDSEHVFDMAARGEHIAIAAPGVDVLAPAPGGAYEVSSGTSLAAAHVTGIVALILQRDPSATPDNVRAVLGATARKPEVADALVFGAGHVDAAQALQRVGAHAGLE